MLTFVIPTAPYHEAAVEKAAASALAQTIRCAVVVVYDHDRRGAGWARNRGLEQVKTPFVSFLDADDWIEPDFAEKCLRAYTGRHYIYTDWYEANYVKAPCHPWAHHTRNIVTTLLPTVFAKRVGGFDEALPFSEDTDFYWKLMHGGLCGKHLPEALFHYGKGGKRAVQAFVNGRIPETGEAQYTAQYHEVMQIIVERYKGNPMSCGGCGSGNRDNGGYEPTPAGEAFDGAVLATALWAGNRQERGAITGRLYPRTGNGNRLWVDPRDVDQAPHKFARVVEMPPPVSENDFQAWRNLTGQLHDEMGVKAAVQQAPAPAYAERGEVAPDVQQVLRLYANQK